METGTFNNGKTAFLEFRSGTAIAYGNSILTNWVVKDCINKSNLVDRKTVENYHIQVLMMGFRNVVTNAFFSAKETTL